MTTTSATYNVPSLPSEGGLSNYLNENMGASGAYDFGFSRAFDAMDTNYVEFVVDSGNSQGQVGGAFDKSLWGNNLYSVSSTASTFGSNANNLSFAIFK